LHHTQRLEETAYMMQRYAKKRIQAGKTFPEGAIFTLEEPLYVGVN
jgi:hypothetical protein